MDADICEQVTAQKSQEIDHDDQKFDQNIDHSDQVAHENDRPNEAQSLLNSLRAQVDSYAENGIKQHSEEWHKAKEYTIGGSTLATIQGVNIFNNENQLVRQRIGLDPRTGNIKTRWGNLFEDVIKRYAESVLCCEILGEDLYIPGPPNTAYSPDGLAVINFTEYIAEEIELPGGGLEIKSVPVVRPAVALIEFKCPQSRIPSGYVPKYYVPQLKMGLDIIKIAEVGLFIEGVFRRCTWSDLGDNPTYDRALAAGISNKLPLAFGIIGIHAIKPLPPAFVKLYTESYETLGNQANNFGSNDLGDSNEILFSMILELAETGVLVIRQMDFITLHKNVPANDVGIVPPADYYVHRTAMLSLNSQLSDYQKFCAEKNYINIGILPWKLFRVDYNYIRRTPNYLSKWMSQIDDVMDWVRECNNAPENMKMEYYNAYLLSRANAGFSR